MPRKRSATPSPLKRQARTQQKYQQALQEELSKNAVLLELKRTNPELYESLVAAIPSSPFLNVTTATSATATTTATSATATTTATTTATAAVPSHSTLPDSFSSLASQPLPRPVRPKKSRVSKTSLPPGSTSSLPASLFPSSALSFSPPSSLSSLPSLPSLLSSGPVNTNLSLPSNVCFPSPLLTPCSSSISSLSGDAYCSPPDFAVLQSLSHDLFAPLPVSSSSSSYSSSFPSARPACSKCPASSSSATTSFPSFASLSSSSSCSTPNTTAMKVKQEVAIPPTRERWEWALRDYYWIPFNEEENSLLDQFNPKKSQIVSLCFRSFVLHIPMMLMVDCATGQQYRLRKSTTPKFVGLPSTKSEFDCVLKLAESGFSLPDAVEGALACNADETAAISWLIARTEEADLSLQINQAMDQSRQQYEVESRTRMQGETEERSKCDIFTYAPFCPSILLHKFPPHLREHVSSCRMSLINLLDLEIKAVSWYPSSRAYFERLSTQLSQLEGTHLSQHLASFITRATNEVQKALFGLPEVGGSVPQLFREVQSWVDDDEVACVNAPSTKSKTIEIVCID